jgi:hypothetical protein
MDADNSNPNAVQAKGFDHDASPPGSEIFTWRSFRGPKTQPHDVRKDPTGTTVVIVQRRGSSRADGDWAINVNLLNSAAAAVRDGRLAVAYVAQAEGQEVLRSAHVDKVVKNIGSAKPRDGVFGPYHWLDANFMPVGFNQSASDEDPF